MDNAERLVSKAYEWVHQAAHELSWDDAYTTTRKGERRGEKRRGKRKEIHILLNYPTGYGVVGWRCCCLPMQVSVRGRFRPADTAWCRGPATSRQRRCFNSYSRSPFLGDTPPTVLACAYFFMCRLARPHLQRGDQLRDVLAHPGGARPRRSRVLEKQRQVRKRRGKRGMLETGAARCHRVLSSK